MPTVNCNGVEIYYERTGRGPTLVLIHGLGGDIRLWAPLISKLKNDLALLAFDLRGSGKTAKPREQYTIEQMADDASSLIEQVCNGAAFVLGFSMGGTVAMNLTMRRPELVKRLILVSTPPSWSSPFPAGLHARELFRKTNVSPELLNDVYETIFGTHYKKKIGAKEYIDFRLDDENPQPLYAYLAQLRALEIYELKGDASAISVPTLIVAGDEDQVVSPKNSKWLKERIPDSELVMLEGAGHMIPIEIPDALARHILSWAR